MDGQKDWRNQPTNIINYYHCAVLMPDVMRSVGGWLADNADSCY
jgi:hypothetical protein